MAETIYFKPISKLSSSTATLANQYLTQLTQTLPKQLCLAQSSTSTANSSSTAPPITKLALQTEFTQALRILPNPKLRSFFLEHKGNLTKAVNELYTRYEQEWNEFSQSHPNNNQALCSEEDYELALTQVTHPEQFQRLLLSSFAPLSVLQALWSNLEKNKTLIPNQHTVSLLLTATSANATSTTDATRILTSLNAQFQYVHFILTTQQKRCSLVDKDNFLTNTITQFQSHAIHLFSQLSSTIANTDSTITVSTVSAYLVQYRNLMVQLYLIHYAQQSSSSDLNAFLLRFDNSLANPVVSENSSSSLEVKEYNSQLVATYPLYVAQMQFLNLLLQTKCNSANNNDVLTGSIWFTDSSKLTRVVEFLLHSVITQLLHTRSNSANRIQTLFRLALFTRDSTSNSTQLTSTLKQSITTKVNTCSGLKLNFPALEARQVKYFNELLSVNNVSKIQLLQYVRQVNGNQGDEVDLNQFELIEEDEKDEKESESEINEEENSEDERGVNDASLFFVDSGGREEANEDEEDIDAEALKQVGGKINSIIQEMGKSSAEEHQKQLEKKKQKNKGNKNEEVEQEEESEEEKRLGSPVFDYSAAELEADVNEAEEAEETQDHQADEQEGKEQEVEEPIAIPNPSKRGRPAASSKFQQPKEKPTSAKKVTPIAKRTRTRK